MPFSQEELSLVVRAVNEHNTQQEAADSLGMSRRSFQRRLYEAKDSSSDADFEEQVLLDNAAENGFPADDVAFYWVKTKTGSFCVKRSDAKSYDDIRDAMISEMKEYAPYYAKIVHTPGEHLLVIDPADIHVGKLCSVDETGFEYNTEIAIGRIRTGVAELVAMAEVHGIDKICLVVGNDILHVDNPTNSTTSGTHQDTSSLWWESFNAAKKCYVALIEQLTQVADVHIVHCPSNHDFASGWMLTDSVYSWFHNHPNVTFDTKIIHRKYLVYGANLIGFTHNDGAKEKDLPNLMQLEVRKEWGSAKFGYWYLHHLHHKIKNRIGKDNSQNLEKDHIGVTVMKQAGTYDPLMNITLETLRSPSPADRWHSTNGCVNLCAIECFLHHIDRGQVARFTTYF